MIILEPPTDKTVYAFSYGDDEGKRVVFLWSTIGVQELDLFEIESEVIIQNVVTGKFESQNETIQLEREPIMFSYHSNSLERKITISGNDAIRKIRIGGF